MVRLQKWVAPVAAANTGVLAAVTLPSSGTTVVTSGFTQPVTPRNIRLKSNQASVDGLSVILAGTDILDQAITETIVMGATATPTDTLNAFKTITSITFPTRGASGDTISVGPGPALALDSYCDEYSFKGMTGVTSFTSDTAVISKNKVILSATLDGSANQGIPYVPYQFPTGRAWG